MYFESSRQTDRGCFNFTFPPFGAEFLRLKFGIGFDDYRLIVEVTATSVRIMATLLGLARIFNYAAANCIRKISPISFCNQYNPASKIWNIEAIRQKHYDLPWMRNIEETQMEMPEINEKHEKQISSVVKEINDQISNNKTGRLFAVVHLCGKQFKITDHDIIIVEGYWPPNPGDELTLEKVLLVGSKDFTLIGRPLLNNELVKVDATVIEKTMTHTKTRFRMRRRKQFRRINFYRMQLTMLRINSISIKGNIDEKKEVEGLDRIY